MLAPTCHFSECREQRNQKPPRPLPCSCFTMERLLEGACAMGVPNWRDLVVKSKVSSRDNRIKKGLDGVFDHTKSGDLLCSYHSFSRTVDAPSNHSSPDISACCRESPVGFRSGSRCRGFEEGSVNEILQLCGISGES